MHPFQEIPGGGTRVSINFPLSISPDKGKSLYLAAEKAAGLDGEFWDVVGSYNGGSALLKAAAVRKTVRAFEPYHKLPEDSDFRWIIGPIYAGQIPQVFEGLENSRVALAHVELVSYQDTKNALAFIVPLLVPNGKIIVDNYGSHASDVTAAVDEMVPEDFLRQTAVAEQVVFTKPLVGLV